MTPVQHVQAWHRAQDARRKREIRDEQAKERQVRKPKSVVENLPPQNRDKARDAVRPQMG